MVEERIFRGAEYTPRWIGLLRKFCPTDPSALLKAHTARDGATAHTQVGIPQVLLEAVPSTVV